MKLANVRTRNDFIEFLKKWDEISGKVENDDYERAADWFVAMQEAKMVFDSYSSKDLANVFLEGLVGINYNPEEYHKNWWNTIWEDIDYARESGDDFENATADEMEAEIIEDLLAALRRLFGVN